MPYLCLLQEFKILTCKLSTMHATCSMPSDVVEQAYHYSQSANLPHAGATSSSLSSAERDESEASNWGGAEGHGASSSGRSSDAPPRTADGSRLPKWFMRPK